MSDRGATQPTGQSSIPSASQLHRDLEMILYAFERGAQLAAGLIVRQPSISDKLKLSHYVSDLTTASTAIRERLIGFLADPPINPTPCAFFQHLSNDLIGILDTDEGLHRYSDEYLPLLHAGLSVVREGVAFFDELTSDVLDLAESRIDRLISDERTSAAIPITALEPGEMLNDRPVLVEIPARPSRSPDCIEATPGTDVPAGPGAGLQQFVFRIELTALEVCSATLAYFPSMPAALRAGLARQIRDEARHFELLSSRMLEYGTSLFQYPVSYTVWDRFLLARDLADVLIIEQYQGEGSALDRARTRIDDFRRRGDQDTANILEYVFGDEIVHVHTAQEWLPRLIPGDTIRARIAEVSFRLGPLNFSPKAIDRAYRTLAGFSEQELDALQSPGGNDSELLGPAPGNVE